MAYDLEVDPLGALSQLALDIDSARAPVSRGRPTSGLLETSVTTRASRAVSHPSPNGSAPDEGDVSSTRDSCVALTPSTFTVGLP